MARPKKAESEDTRGRILVAAEREFGAVGFYRARLEDIAGAAGIRRPSLLYYFDSKEELYTEVAARVAADLRELVVSTLTGCKTAEERIEDMMSALLEFATERRSSIAMFVRELLDELPGSAERLSGFIALVDSIEQFFATDAAHLVPEGPPLRAAVIGVITSHALRIASGELGPLLWGDADDPRPLVRSLLSRK